MLRINDDIAVPLSEIEISAVRAQGSGGQNVNKVSTAVHLRFDIAASSLPQTVKDRLLGRRDSRLTREGVLVIKSQRHRTQERNREEALDRLREIIAAATRVRLRRKPTRPTRASRAKRIESKIRRGRLKTGRGRVGSPEGEG